MRAALVLILLVLTGSFAHAQMTVGDLDGPVTPAETDSLLAYIAAMQPAASNEKNAWSYGVSGQAIRALGLINQIVHDPRFVDQMVRFCDAQLTERNDLAAPPLGQHMIWTGRIDPAWPNDLSEKRLSTGGEQGDLIGNLGNCAVTILKMRALWTKPVPFGDPHHFGSTYLERARTYVRHADFVIDHHVLDGLLDLSHDDHQYFSAASPYKGGSAVPWNQVMMFNYGFQMLASAHAMLHDAPARATRYHRIVADNIEWFFTAGVRTVTTKRGRQAYDWGYALPSQGGEDCVHARMDVAGLYLSYLDGSYPVTRAEMTRLANTFTDVITLAPGSYAGRVNGTSGTGHAAATNKVKNGFLFLLEFQPATYDDVVRHAVTQDQSVAVSEGGTTGDIDLFARYLWAKSRHLHPQQ
ncbi:MAG: hypothetical protein PW789_01935 [Edaphobacter sp.]|uniref:hypothetical protein n=1 Tax=Edaphobacter sp. TaxID=1934404 RepID=UPI00238C8A81|nr:hypothetical protein [Edaphobacter sp.]MDE1175348.1 hypothetical protein [Edaphobacter sp.]